MGRPGCGCIGGGRPAGWCSGALVRKGEDFYAAWVRAFAPLGCARRCGAGYWGFSSTFCASSRRFDLQLDVTVGRNVELRIATSG